MQRFRQRSCRRPAVRPVGLETVDRYRALLSRHKIEIELPIWQVAPRATSSGNMELSAGPRTTGRGRIPKWRTMRLSVAARHATRRGDRIRSSTQIRDAALPRPLLASWTSSSLQQRTPARPSWRSTQQARTRRRAIRESMAAAAEETFRPFLTPRQMEHANAERMKQMEAFAERDEGRRQADPERG